VRFLFPNSLNTLNVKPGKSSSTRAAASLLYDGRFDDAGASRAAAADAVADDVDDDVQVIG